jgi:hypothetical protein
MAVGDGNRGERTGGSSALRGRGSAFVCARACVSLGDGARPEWLVFGQTFTYLRRERVCEIVCVCVCFF